MTTRELAKMALYTALFLALDYISGNFLPRMPQGGSLGLSTIVLIIASFDLGIQKAGLLTIVCLLLSFMTDPPYFLNFIQYILDYGIGYLAYAFAVLFANRNGNERSFQYFVLPILIPNAIRFFSSSLAGVLYYEVNWTASMIYQSGYIVPTIIVSFIILPVLLRRIKPYLKR